MRIESVRSVALLFATLLAVRFSQLQSVLADFRPPAVSLVTYNPFLSIWSEADHLNVKTTQRAVD